jgi:uncharacterized membrane protein (UPF0127 family)
MAEYYQIENERTGATVLIRARACRSFWSHFKGLQFSRKLTEGEGLWFVTNGEGRSHTAIHMFFVFFSIGVVWTDSQGVVVDKQLAKPWRPFYGPAYPARDFIEALPSIMDQVEIGDTLTFRRIARS